MGSVLISSTGPSGYDIAALIVAGVAAAMALASLVWNIAEYRLTGPRIKVRLVFGAFGPGGVVTSPSPPKDPTWLVRQGFTEPLVGIDVVNKGRAPTEVQHFRCKLSNGIALADVGHLANPPIPYVLQPHRSKTWWIPAMEVQAIVQASRSVADPATSAHMEVDVTGPKTLPTSSFSVK